MSLRSGDRFGQVFANELGSETRPGGEEASIDGLCPGLDNWAEAGTVEVAYEIRECRHVLDAVDEWEVVWRITGRWWGWRSGR